MSACWDRRASRVTARRSRSTRARRSPSSPTSRSPSAATRATRWRSCCGPAATTSTLAAPCGEPSRPSGRPSATIRSRRPASASAWPPTGRLDIDVHRFRRLALDGAGEKELETAVELFGGELLEGFSLRDSPAFEDWHRLEADSLERELDAALERLVEARASRGDFVGAIRYAQRRLELDALHEPAHRQLIRLLAWNGDRADALTQYRTCVRVLSSELGVAPLPETTDLYQGISEGGLEPPAGSGAPPPARAGARSELPLVGREVEWGALAAAYERVGPDGHAMVLEGEAGIGKTRLAEAFLVHAREHGGVTLSQPLLRGGVRPGLRARGGGAARHACAATPNGWTRCPPARSPRRRACCPSWASCGATCRSRRRSTGQEPRAGSWRA